MVEFNVRIDFFRSIERDQPPKDYVGSASRVGLHAVALPRVGEYVHGLGDAEVWYGRQGRTGGPYSAVAAVEHAPVPAFKAKLEGEPSVRLVVWALWPGDGPMAGPRMLAEYDAEGWTLQFFSEHAPVERLPGQPLM